MVHLVRDEKCKPYWETHLGFNSPITPKTLNKNPSLLEWTQTKQIMRQTLYMNFSHAKSWLNLLVCPGRGFCCVCVEWLPTIHLFSTEEKHGGVTAFQILLLLLILGLEDLNKHACCATDNEWYFTLCGFLTQSASFVSFLLLGL